MKKILVCGDNHYGYIHSLARGLAAGGVDAGVYRHARIHVRKLASPRPLTRWRAAGRLWLLNRGLLRRVARDRPDGVVCISGEALLPDTVRRLAAQRPVALWLVDRLANTGLTADLVQLYPVQLVFEPADLALFPRAHYLPYGADPAHYRPLQQSARYAVGFVGAPHANRLPILEHVAGICRRRGWSLALCGPFRNRRALARQWPGLAQAIAVNRKLAPQEVNAWYNATAINLNLHHDQSVEGVNPRTFEILAAGACQLVDHKPRLADWFVDGRELAMFQEPEELEARLAIYLERPAERAAMAQRGYAACMAQHTMAHRARHIVEWLFA